VAPDFKELVCWGVLLTAGMSKSLLSFRAALSKSEDTVLFLAAASVEELMLAAEGELSRGPVGVRRSSALLGRGEGSAQHNVIQGMCACGCFHVRRAGSGVLAQPTWQAVNYIKGCGWGVGGRVDSHRV
jgi:hypothetical protein